MLALNNLNFHDCRDSGVELYEFIVFLDSGAEYLNFHEVRDSGVQLKDLHDFRDSVVE